MAGNRNRFYRFVFVQKCKGNDALFVCTVDCGYNGYFSLDIRRLYEKRPFWKILRIILPAWFAR